MDDGVGVLVGVRGVPVEVTVEVKVEVCVRVILFLSNLDLATPMPKQ